MLINAGIKRIFFDEAYDDDLADAMLDEAGIEIMRFET
jgi:deoxycytidylate deaminase